MTCKKIFFLFLWVLPAVLFAQKEQVSFKVRNVAPLRKFELAQNSVFDIVNGKLNTAIVSANGYVFEINGINARMLGCKAILKQKNFKATLIDNQLNRTYTSSAESKGTLRIFCKPDGIYVLEYTGDIYQGKQKVIVNATLIGTINHSQDLKTNTK